MCDLSCNINTLHTIYSSLLPLPPSTPPTSIDTNLPECIGRYCRSKGVGRNTNTGCCLGHRGNRSHYSDICSLRRRQRLSSQYHSSFHNTCKRERGGERGRERKRTGGRGREGEKLVEKRNRYLKSLELKVRKTRLKHDELAFSNPKLICSNDKLSCEYFDITLLLFVWNMAPPSHACCQMPFSILNKCQCPPNINGSV